MRLFAAAAAVISILALATCGTPAAPRSAEIEGTLSVGGANVAPTACRPGRSLRTYVAVVTPRGVLRFEDQELSWNRDASSILPGEPLTCTRIDRSWGGGSRADGSAYWRGTLAFDCKLGDLAITGDLKLDCGQITAEERQQLDGQRERMREDQRKAREPAPS